MYYLDEKFSAGKADIGSAHKGGEGVESVVLVV